MFLTFTEKEPIQRVGFQDVKIIGISGEAEAAL